MRLPTESDAARRGAAIGVLSNDGLRVLVDSEVLSQAVYLYRPILADDGSVADLEVALMNRAAHRVPLSSHIVEGLRTSTVFVDNQKATDAATIAWQGGVAPKYEIERRGFVGGQPVVVRYEVSTFRMGEYIVQVSIDHSTTVQLASADARFRMMAEASEDGLVLVARDPGDGHFVVLYANPAAFVGDPALRVGRRLPEPLEALTIDVVDALRSGRPIRRRTGVGGVTRRVEVEVSFALVADDQVMLTTRTIDEHGFAASDLERSERVLAAIGAGAFGTIAVFQPLVVAEELVGLDLLWQSRRPDGGAIDPLAVLPAADLLATATEMLAAGEHQRSGWVQVGDGNGVDRSVEFTIVLAGDRFVLEFVERTEELAARAALAMVNATSEAQRSFLSRVSHEMRSPLNVIQGYSQLLRRLQLPGAADDHVARIGEGVERMVQIVDDLLLLSQVEKGLLRLDHQLVEVGDVIAEVLTTAPRHSWWRDGGVVSSTARSPVTVRTDRARLVTIAMLLLEASVGVCGETVLEMSAFARGTKAGLRMAAPSGCPVVAEVWRPFAESHVIPGEGLGLAVARGLAEALGIAVEVRTSDGQSALLLLLDPVGEPVGEPPRG